MFAGVMVILALQFFTGYFEYIPKAALAAVIISAILFMVEYDVVKPMWRAKSEFRPRAPRRRVPIRRANRTLLPAELDLVPGVGTFVLCLTLPLELGILAGVVANLVFILYHAARPKFSVEMLKVGAARAARPRGARAG